MQPSTATDLTVTAELPQLTWRWYARLITSGEPVNAVMACELRIFKIKCGHVTHCFTAGIHGEYSDMPFPLLESIVRRLFQLPASSNFTINYTDKDNDEMTIASDGDVYNACVVQDLNPVRCTVLLEGEESRRSARFARPPGRYARLITSGEPVNAVMACELRIFKIKCGHVTHCVTAGIHGEYSDMPFPLLESIVRRLFQLPASSNFTINYTDKDNDEMTIASDGDVYNACVVQDLNPVRCTVLLEGEESRRSARFARPPGPLTVDPPQWAVDISLKLDQLLLAVNKLLVVPVAPSGRPTSTKVEDHFVVVDDSPIDDPTPKKMEERFLIKGESSIAGRTIEPAKDADPSKDRAFDNAQSGQSDSEFLKRATLLQQRGLTGEVSEAVGRGAESTEVSGCGSKSVAGASTGAPKLEGPVGLGLKRGFWKMRSAKHG